MKPLLVSLVLIASLTSGFAAHPSSANRKIGDMNVIPTRVLQRSISPKFYRSLLVSPVEGWVVVRANLSGTRLTGARVIHSELQGLYDPLALQLAKEALIAGNYSIDRPNTPGSVLLHVLVYRIADGTMVLSFAHLDHPGGNQMEYYGCARLLTLKADKWTEIMGPESLQGKGWAVRQGVKNNLMDSLRLEGRLAAESTNYNLDAGGHHDRRGY
ncbi:MAG: hypothetical protein QOE26_2316 [Verrucomicrobiota bacterium]|jgi:hypothetical protein